MSEMQSHECPVTAIDAETENLLTAVTYLKAVSQFGSGQGLGPVLEWPAWLQDAAYIIMMCEQTVEEKLMVANSSNR